MTNPPAPPAADDAAGPAFAAARAICRRHARTFYFASVFLPPAKRAAAYAVYAFCRLLDDATDEATDEADVAGRIARFEAVLDDVYAGRAAAAGGGDDEASLALEAFAATVRRYDVPREHFAELAAGCRMDLTVNRYATWAELQVYCYRVAGVVGLVMCRLFGLDDPAAERQAVQMGEAMQLTNILRDVGEDHGRGRVYLPAEDLARFGYAEAELAAGVVDDRFRDLMRFEVARARQLYREAAAGLVHLADDGSRSTAAAMAVVYAGILAAIERRRYDVLGGRARLTLPQKLWRLPKARRLARRRAGQPVPNVF